MGSLRTYPAKWLWRIYFAVLAASLLLGILWRMSGRLHYHFAFQYLLEFFALFGFFGCLALILIAKGLGFFIVTPEEPQPEPTEEPD